MTFGSMIDEFKALNTELVGLSVDSIYSHIAWLRKIQELEWNGKKHINVTFPLIEDIRMEVANKYGMIQPGQSNTQAVRAVFVIDPNGVMRTILYYPLRPRQPWQAVPAMTPSAYCDDVRRNDDCALRILRPGRE